MSRLRREVGFWGAVLLGLGSILGTGVFVSIGLAAETAGSALIWSTLTAVTVATCIALNVAQLAASHPVSGGTYEYGYRYLNPTFGFAAGWTFLLAKGFSAAAASLGFAGYLRALTGIDIPPRILAIGTTLILTALVWSGIKRSSTANVLIVSVTLAVLVLFVIVGGIQGVSSPGLVDPAPRGSWRGYLEGAAFMYVAFAGYGRLSTLGEEIVDPKRTIPRAIITTLGISAALYVGVALVAINTAGAEFGRAAVETAAPLIEVARLMDSTAVRYAVSIGALTALLSVLLNLILGLSRVLLAMARRGDMPRFLAQVNEERGTPVWAVLAVGLVVAALGALGNVRVAWSFSAFTLLIYYGITSYAAVRLPAEYRRYPVALGWFGTVACTALAAFIEPRTLVVGVGLIALGFVWRWGLAIRAQILTRW